MNKDNKNVELILSDQEREYINVHLSERVKTDCYWDNPDLAIEDVKWLLEIIKKDKTIQTHLSAIAQNPLLSTALLHPLWNEHKIGDTYTMDGNPDLWKITYYPIFEDGKNNKPYSEARALIEKPIVGGTDFREVPLRYLSKSS